MSLSEYLKLLGKLPFLNLHEHCCDASDLILLTVEPLEGRRMAEVSLTCIARCETCGMEFVTWWGWPYHQLG